MANPAIVDDLVARWRPLSADETSTAQARLGDAWAVLLSKVPGIDDRAAAETDYHDLVVYVVCQMVLRAMRNPEGYQQETTGPFSVTRAAGDASGGVYVTADELAMLQGTTAAAVGTIDVQPAWPTRTLPWWLE